MPEDIIARARQLPAVDTVLRSPAAQDLERRFGRSAVADAVRMQIAALRDRVVKGSASGPADCLPETVLRGAARMLEDSLAPKLRRAVNATGIILHTGLGRAVMPDEAAAALAGSTGCCNVQLELGDGSRIEREQCIRGLVRELTGAEEAVLVNNNAAATLLVLRALARGREAIVSRGELIEIGGSFRLPDIMEESGAILREVGTTNKTHLRDYERAICPDTAMILKVHKSNYTISGFTREVSIEELARLGKARGIPVVDDLGCGAMVGLEQFGLAHEPTVRESLAAGADIALFSTDKLIGGPQGGLIAGRQDLLSIVRTCPLYRAMRVCKLTLAALEATLKLFRSPELLAGRHPVYAMLAKRQGEMKTQADELMRLLAAARPDWKMSVVETVSYLGGGSLPGEELPSWAVGITSADVSADALATALRTAATPVVARVKDDTVLLDMRTVAARELPEVVRACER